MTHFQHFEGAKTKYCSNCCQHRPVEGGKQILINKGRNQRFLCEWCVKDREKRAA